FGRCGEAAGLVRVPRQPAPGIAPLDDGIVPAHIQDFGGNTRCCRVREGAKIADAGVDVELAVRREAQEAVKSVRAGRVVALTNPDAGHLAAVALARTSLLLIPLEHARALVERLLEEGGRER